MFETDLKDAIAAANSDRGDTVWNEITNQYRKASRHYHTLEHLNNLYLHLQPLKKKFVSWQVVVFAIAYHDFVYNVLRKNNEEKSAKFAEKRLTEIGFSPTEISLCCDMILATKTHAAIDKHEINLFTDADLSILGADEKQYTVYTEQVKCEYSLYPDMIYFPGRRKVVEHFLKMPAIFKTTEFYERFEVRARQNLENELVELSHR